jgi:hypothetical protein
MTHMDQTEKSDRPPSRSVLLPEPDIDAKQPANRGSIRLLAIP